MKPYIPGKAVAEVQRELGLTDVVKLASNENPLGPSPRAISAARRALEYAHIYPEGPAPELRAEIARRWAVDPAWVFVANGSDETFRTLAEAYLRPGDRCVIPENSFSAYRIVAELMGAELCYVPLRDGAMDLPAMAAACRRPDGAPARLVFLCRPNNPTGGVFPAEALAAFMAAVPPETLVVLDEAYAEFDSSGFDSRPFLLRHPNLIVSRTFSKLYGLAGLRVGYALACPDIWPPVWTVRDPFSVNIVAQAAARAALDDRDHIESSLDISRDGKALLAAELPSLKLTVYPTEANFTLVDLHREARPVYEALLRRGVIVRPCASFGLPTCIRITHGLQPELRRCIEALRIELV